MNHCVSDTMLMTLLMSLSPPSSCQVPALSIPILQMRTLRLKCSRVASGGTGPYF